MNFLTPRPEQGFEVRNVLDTTFDWIDEIYPGVKVILDADKVAKAEAGGSVESTVYYQTLWSEVGQYTAFSMKPRPSASPRSGTPRGSRPVSAAPGTSAVQCVHHGAAQDDVPGSRLLNQRERGITVRPGAGRICGRPA